MAVKGVNAVAFERLHALYSAYLASGFDYLDHSTPFDREEWYDVSNAEGHEMLRLGIGYVHRIGRDQISRRQVFSAVENVGVPQALHRDAVLWQAFVAIMVWNFRPGSYGPWLADEMLSTEEMRRSMRSAREALNDVAGGPTVAYRRIARKINRLGPAFGTKVLYFLSPVGNRAPIFDSVVANWMWRYGVCGASGKSLSPVQWSVKTYGYYVDFVTQAALDLDIGDRGLVEYLMFVDARHSDHLAAGHDHPNWLTESGLGGWSNSE